MSDVFSGARAKVRIMDRNTGKPRVVGIFSTISWSLRYTVEPIYTLGNFGPVALQYTSMEPVSIQASGWRFIGHGAHVEANIPRLQDLLDHQYIEMDVVDRQAEATGQGVRMARFRSVKPVGYSTTVNARGLEEVSVEFTALRVDDESVENAEHPTAAQLP